MKGLMMTKELRYLFITCGVILCAFADPAQAQFAISSSVLDGSGTRASGGSWTNISASGQPGGITVSEGGGMVNQAGFLNTFLLRQDLDTDGDGLADELDPDNDNDGLTDVNEVGGGSFSPGTPTLVNLADTDGDGILDGWEAVSGTDPTDPGAHLQFTAISNAPGGRSVSWLARGNNEKTYVVYSRDSVIGELNTVIFSNTLAGGVSPWFAITNELTDISATGVEFYAVEVYP